MNNTENIQKLKKLYQELFELLEPYYNKYDFIGYYMDITENIINYLNTNTDKEEEILSNVWLKSMRGFNRFDDNIYTKICDKEFLKKIEENGKEIRKILR